MSLKNKFLLKEKSFFGRKKISLENKFRYQKKIFLVKKISLKNKFRYRKKNFPCKKISLKNKSRYRKKNFPCKKKFHSKINSLGETKKRLK